MPEGLTFRLFKEEDLPRISIFRKSFFPYNSSIRSYEPEYYEWKCYKNPVQQGEMWLAEEGDTIVGIKNITPKRMKVLGTVVNGVEMGDSFTHPDYQRRGIFTILSKAARESAFRKGISLIYNTPGKKTSLPGYLKNLNHAPVPIKLRSLVKLLNPKPLLKMKLPFSPLASILSPIIEIVSRATLKIGMCGIAKSNISVYQELSFPDDIDTLWEQVSKNYDIMLVRTKDYLEWRYVMNPDSYSILIARNKDGDIVGYIVTKIGFSGDIPNGFIVDFLTIEDDPNIFKKLLAASIEEFYRKRVNTVSTHAVKGSFYDKILLRFGFLPYGKISLLCYKNELGSQVIGKDYKWHFTMGDTDGI